MIGRDDEVHSPCPPVIRPLINMARGADLDRLKTESQQKSETISHLRQENFLLKSQKPESTDSDSAVNIVEMQTRNAQLLIQLREAEEQTVQLKAHVMHLEQMPRDTELVNIVRPEVRTVTVENSEHIERLRDTIRKMQEENLNLREELQLKKTQQAHIQVEYRNRFVEKPQVELRYVEVENVDKLGLLQDQVKELEQELSNARAQVSDWRTKYARMEQQPLKTEVRLVEIESSTRVSQLIEDLNKKESDNVLLRKKIIELEHNPQKQIEYSDHEVFIEVPQVEVQQVEVENTEQLAQMHRILEMKDKELHHARHEVEHARESQRRLEANLADVLRMGRTSVAQSSPPPAPSTQQFAPPPSAQFVVARPVQFVAAPSTQFLATPQIQQFHVRA